MVLGKVFRIVTCRTDDGRRLCDLDGICRLQIIGGIELVLN